MDPYSAYTGYEGYSAAPAPDPYTETPDMYSAVNSYSAAAAYTQKPAHYNYSSYGYQPPKPAAPMLLVENQAAPGVGNTYAAARGGRKRSFSSTLVLQEDLENAGGNAGGAARTGFTPLVNDGSFRGGARGRGRGAKRGGASQTATYTVKSYNATNGSYGNTSATARGSFGGTRGRGGRGGGSFYNKSEKTEWGDLTASNTHPAQALALFFPEHNYDEITRNICPKTSNMRVSMKLTIPSRNNSVFVGTGISPKIAKHEAAHSCLTFFSVPGCTNMVNHITEKDKAKMDEMADPAAKKMKTVEGVSIPLNCISYVHKLYGPEIEYLYETVCLMPRAQFKCAITVQGSTFEEVASSKKAAKEAVCETCIKAFEHSPPPRVNSYKPSEGGEKDEKPEILTPETPNEHLIQKVYAQIREKTLNLHPAFHRMSNVAGIVLINGANDDPKNFQVISVATGKNVVVPKSFKTDGTVVHDSSADVLVIRAFRNYLYDELEKAIDGKSSILESSGDNYRLKPQYSVALAKNEPPIGDCLAYEVSVQHGPKRRWSFYPPCDRSKPGTLQYYSLPLDPEADFNPQNMKVFTAAKISEKVENSKQPTEKHTIACPSDKMTILNIAGIQGALLSQFIEPIYFNKIVFNNHVNVEAINRALVGRIESFIYKVPHPYSVNKPDIAKSNMRLFNAKQQSVTYSGWANCNTQWESIKTDIGLRQSKPKNYPTRKQYPNEVEYYTKKLAVAKELEGTLCPSSLCKKSLSEKYTAISRKLGREVPETYLQCKMLANEYHSVKLLAFSAFKKADSGVWVKKTVNVAGFKTGAGKKTYGFNNQDY